MESSTKNKYAMFCHTLSDPELVGTTEDDHGNPCWLLFDTEREVHLEIIDDLEEHIRQFKAGERGFDEIAMDLFAAPVYVLPTGEIVSKEFGVFPQIPH